ncbi:MAG: pitrilysin family protein [Candidatus Pacearchaeota archaeon]
MAKFTKKVLPNGFTIIYEKRDVPVVSLILATRFGSAFESENKKGIAHFLEHMCFKGTKRRSAKQISEEIESIGGILNAFTHEETTAYHTKVPSKYWKNAFDVIFDIFFNPNFPEEEIKKEALVVCEEIKMYNDNPQYFVLNKIKEALYKKPFGLPISGNKENVLSFNKEKLLEIHKNFYNPKNSILVVVGDISFENVLSFVENNLPKNSNLPIKKETKTEKKNEKLFFKRKELTQTNLSIGFHFPLSTEKESYAAKVFNSILGEGMSSKLFLEVREKRGLAYAIKSDLDIGKNYSYLYIYAGTDEEKKDEVIKVSLEEFSKLSDLTERELEKAKEKVIGNFLLENEDSLSAATNLLMFEITKKAEEYYKFEENIKKVYLEEIKRLAEKKDYSLIVLEPGN